MLTTNLTALQRFFTRIKVYRQVHLVYWNRQLSEERRQQREIPAAEQQFAKARYEKTLSDYQSFITQTLDDYTADLMRYRASIKREPLLQNFMGAMRKELKAEEERIFRSQGKGCGTENGLRPQLQQMAAHAVSRLKNCI